MHACFVGEGEGGTGWLADSGLRMEGRHPCWQVDPLCIPPPLTGPLPDPSRCNACLPARVQYEGSSPPAHMILAAGMCSSSIAQFAAYPLALTRTRLQAQGIGGRPIKYRGMMDVLRKTVQHEGVRGLYKVGCARCMGGWGGRLALLVLQGGGVALS